MGAEYKARVFISCGQRLGDEVNIAHRIAERLRELGYEPYIAVEEQTLEGVKENIFRQLANSEYLIFIDFKREKLDIDSHESIYRGSVFCHQELAIASFLDIDFIPFQEYGVKKDDGILNYIQSNCIPFSDRHLLENVIADKITQKRWNPHWKNQLILKDQTKCIDVKLLKRAPDGQITTSNKLVRFYHIEVKNLHIRKTALNCYAYLKSIENLYTGKIQNPELVELKWKGCLFPNVAILPSSSRYIDAFYVYYESPQKILFNRISDYTEYLQLSIESGDYRLTYSVVSQNFETAEETFTLHIGNQIGDIKFGKDTISETTQAIFQSGITLNTVIQS